MYPMPLRGLPCAFVWALKHFDIDVSFAYRGHLETILFMEKAKFAHAMEQYAQMAAC